MAPRMAELRLMVGEYKICVQAQMTNKLIITEYADKWLISGEGLFLSQFVVAAGLTLCFCFVGEGENIDTRISGKFLFNDHKNIFQLDAKKLTEIGVVFMLQAEDVAKLVIYKNGILEIYFLDDRSIVVDPDPNDEAWELCTNSDYHFVCAPGGGEVYVWDPK